ncbi:hypothetical protein A3B21_00240 [Candidatus Uhrbacteria bacterium RIFCSPLOWO2_01_FULL_47_24]|uniref:MnmC-like methyltransferase domain-containing protein n=1 Tax=Candidatus Uhrbacteria bacterium RIFCSPLOWO2_01_FULL_47_24 TaxID=1802401 RepID=A0A1F7USS1_9BACT|nr:MAG: hypothetical protein A2753_03870 [Candidatus Uhrbacteria bacterium RIFCSPHIGHO2_01_FULL_47_11]OGL69038.1 MAG: hypothetical protein A3D58_00260 [Candidatus Uhrbacteria bacterium RIFCSPHIGHO2_02_FULL_46_47]OGL81340.1 MAG: hypothetical protein A3B21_00240 [Candidatus Uhrbacteria bacterium RIFCSPLOWO2_01_FULL_47_24]OGL83916.1 MAG: hypothetical protein A3J03_00665 [Candidatus Uhrbacteria bacterium RIFCSPLOWO2_02_FULL_46_25]OGL91626.1 MAG: hypothetical protein A3H11_04925 [Candidatus Uhrbacte
MSSTREQYEKHQEYIKQEGLEKLINFSEGADYQEGVFDMVRGGGAPMPPQADDLVRLHKLIHRRKCFTVLEFGVGYSTVIIADALQKNERDWQTLGSSPEIRNRFMFQVFSVDASKQWLEHVQAKLPSALKDRVHLYFSEVEIGTYNGQICHYYKELPDIVPDFIYLDGPAPKDVQGTFRGMSFQCDERTVMSGDLLTMEPTFLPGTFILVDGRTNNARFLERNFKRTYEIKWDRQGDVTTFELKEERLGKYNLLGSDFFRS